MDKEGHILILNDFNSQNLYNANTGKRANPCIE